MGRKGIIGTSMGSYEATPEWYKKRWEKAKRFADYCKQMNKGNKYRQWGANDAGHRPDAENNRCHPYIKTKLETGNTVKVEHSKYGIGQVVGIADGHYLVSFEGKGEICEKLPFSALRDKTLRLIV